MPRVQTIPSLIWVKQFRGRASKLEFDDSGNAPTTSRNELSEFCALRQAQRKQKMIPVHSRFEHD
jgi:hypothetical protein